MQIVTLYTLNLRFKPLAYTTSYIRGFNLREGEGGGGGGLFKFKKKKKGGGGGGGLI